MKVKEFIKRFNIASNAIVKIVHCPDKDWTILSQQELRDMEPASIMNMTLSSFTIYDNVVTIYARG